MRQPSRGRAGDPSELTRGVAALPAIGSTDTSGRALSRGVRPLVAVTLVLLASLGPLVIGLHLPSAAQMGADLTATPGELRWNFTLYLLGIAVGQLVFGPLSDRLGRRGLLVMGCAAGAILCVLCALSRSIEMLAVLRFLLGLCLSTGMVLASAIAADRSRGRGMVWIFTVLAMTGTVLPLFSPALGTVVAAHLGWRGMYWALAAASGALCLLTLLLVPESLSAQDRWTQRLAGYTASLRAVLGNRRYLGYGVVRIMSFTAVIAYISGAPPLLQEWFGSTGTGYALVFACGAAGLCAAMLFAVGGLPRARQRTVVMVGSVASAVCGLGVVLAALLDGGRWTVLVPLIAAVTALGLVVGNSSVMAIDSVREAKGTGSALLGCAMFFVGSLVPSLLAAESPAEPAVLGAVMLGCAVVAAVVTGARPGSAGSR